MKVPLEKEPFAPFTLSRDQENLLKWLTDTRIDATFAQYEEFTTEQNRVIDKDRWKSVMSREDVTIYRRAGKGDLGEYTPKVSLGEPNAKPTSEYWRVPTVLGIGTIAGELDDMLYGLIAMTHTETAVRTSYVKDEAPDSRVLATVIRPTVEDPLSAMLIRWTLSYQTLHKIGVATPRDILYLESVGTRILPNGERMGYYVVQSLDVPGCGELTDLNVIRIKMSACYLLRDTGNGSVELYMRSNLDPGGRLVDRIAVFIVSSSLISIWRIMLCGQYKKLAWMVRRASASRSRSLTTASGADECPICSKLLSVLRSPSRCDICLAKVCSRCSDKRKLTHIVSSTQIKRVTTCICRTCITIASNTSARDVAISEYVSATRRGTRTTSVYSPFGWTTPAPASSTSTSQAPSSHSKASTADGASRSLSSSASTSYDVSFDSLGRESCDDEASWNLTTAAHACSPQVIADEAYAGFDAEQLQLWMRMNQLRMTAEETYLITKQNATVMQDAGSTINSTRPY